MQLFLNSCCLRNSFPFLLLEHVFDTLMKKSTAEESKTANSDARVLRRERRAKACEAELVACV